VYELPLIVYRIVKPTITPTGIKGTLVMTVSTIRLPNGDDLSASLATCEGCGSTMDEHSCGGAGTGGGSVTYTSARSTGPRKPKADRPPCAHCGGAMHFNMGATAVNAECVNRQYSVDIGEMTDPNAALPVLTLERMQKIVEWAARLSSPISYGKMASAAGGASTYSGLRPKTGRKKKAVAAAAGSKIEDLASEEAEAISEETPAPTKAKRSKTRKARAKLEEEIVAQIDEGEDEQVGTVEDLDEGEVIAEAEEILEDPTEDEAPVVDSEETARDERARRREERSARRKELLRSGNL
jgi:hypothetical protein